MKKLLITFYLALGMFLSSYGQTLGRVDTITDFSRLTSIIEVTESLFIEIKSREFDRLEKILASNWGNKPLFKKIMSEIADSLDIYGIPDTSRLTVTERTIPVIDFDFSTTFVEFTYNINTPYYDKNETFTVEFTFTRDGNELSLHSIHSSKPPSEEFQKLLNKMLEDMNKEK